MLTHDCFCPGAEDINAAAEAAEKVTSDVNQLVADLAQGSDNKDAVEDAYEQRWAVCHWQGNRQQHCTAGHTYVYTYMYYVYCTLCIFISIC